MSNVLDRVFNEVCLDERVSDGIFRMEATEHMDALRDFFVKKGITKEAAIHVTNRMMEGKYPDRQAYRKEDGILVTWPSPKHKHKAMHENPGKYVEQNPFPKRSEPSPEYKPEKQRPEKQKPDVEIPYDIDDTDKEPENKDNSSGSNLFDKETNSTIQQGDKQLSVEPIKGTQPVGVNNLTPVVQQPKTPARIAAEKEVSKQVVATDDTALTNVTNPLTEAYRQQIIKELYTRADKLGLREVVTFLTPYVNS